MMKNIYAMTETTARSYPGFVSVNAQDDGTVSISVRSTGAQTAGMVNLTTEQASDMRDRLTEYLQTRLAPAPDADPVAVTIDATPAPKAAK